MSAKDQPDGSASTPAPVPAPAAGPSAPAAGPSAPAIGPSAPATGSSPEATAGMSPVAAGIDPRVAEVLQQLRSGVRQRQAEAATMGAVADPLATANGGTAPGGAAGFAHALLAVRSSEYVREPVPFSHRPRLGKLIVASRKAFYHLFLKWFARPVLAQQNVFNQAAGRLLQELAEAEERTAREARQLAARLDELERRR